jgi:hypothetical protein
VYEAHGYSGAVWGTWILDRIQSQTRKIQEDDNRPSCTSRVLSVTLVELKTKSQVELNPDNLSFSVCAIRRRATGTTEKRNQQEKILDLLTEYAPKALTGREILEETGLPRSAYNTLNMMVERRSITQRQSKTDHRSMVYCLKVPPSPP